MLDSRAMISVNTPKDEYGLVDVKPLGVIWGLFPDFYNADNTIMLDEGICFSFLDALHIFLIWSGLMICGETF